MESATLLHEGWFRLHQRDQGKCPVKVVKPTWRDFLTATKPAGSAKQVLKVIKWIQANCVHTNDRWLGKPFNILPWQYFIILALFTVGADGLRVVR